jgi:hypothetical protein
MGQVLRDALEVAFAAAALAARQGRSVPEVT